MRGYYDPPEYDPVFKCDRCGCDIYEGEDCYLIEGERICSDCIDDFKRVAEPLSITDVVDEDLLRGGDR